MDSEFANLYHQLSYAEQQEIRSFIRDLLEAHESAASPAPARQA